jgi:hypothetical protein
VLDAVDEAYSEAHPVILGLLAVPSSLTRVFSESSGGASAEIVRQNVLENSDFLRILVPRVDRLLADKGLVCEGGPSIPLLALRTVSWLDASRFLRGFISVPRVHTVDVEGQPLPIPRYSFKICTGGAGQELVRLDPSLGAAMFTTALESQAIIGDILDDARGRPAFLDLFTDEARTTFLGEEVSRRLEFDGRVLAHACEVLRQYREDLGIAVTECPVEASPPVPPQEHR